MASTNDITTRLRAMSRYAHDDLSIGDEAADVIERLRIDMHSCHPDCSRAGCVNGRLREEIERLRQEYERLTAENRKLAKVLKAAVELVCAPAWAGISDEDCELERVLRECRYVKHEGPNAAANRTGPACRDRSG